MKVRVSFTTKTIVLLLAMVLTVSVVISAVLIKESEARLLLQQKESQVNNQRRVQLFQEILHNRMITLIDVINQSTSSQLNDLNSLQETLNRLSEYLALNFQVDKLYLFDSNGLRNIVSSQPDSTVTKLVNVTRVTFDSRSVMACDTICTHYTFVNHDVKVCRIRFRRAES